MHSATVAVKCIFVHVTSPDLELLLPLVRQVCLLYNLAFWLRKQIVVFSAFADDLGCTTNTVKAYITIVINKLVFSLMTKASALLSYWDVQVAGWKHSRAWGIQQFLLLLEGLIRGVAISYSNHREKLGVGGNATCWEAGPHQSICPLQMPRRRVLLIHFIAF
jgi:hypothetical protein